MFSVNDIGKVATPAAVWQPGGTGSYTLASSDIVNTPPAEQLPYQAYGVGLAPGARVVALNGANAVGAATVDAGGNWVFDIPSTAAMNGDLIRFTVDGRPASETVVFQTGQFALPPGISLTTASGAGTGTFVSPPNFGSGTARRWSSPAAP